MRFANREEYERWKQSRAAAQGAAGSGPPETRPSPSATSAPLRSGEGAGAPGWKIALLFAGGLAVAALLVWAGYLAAPAEPGGGDLRTDPMKTPRLFTTMTAGLTAAALGFLLRRADAAARLEGGERILRYPTIWRWIVPLTSPIPFLLLGFAIGFPAHRAALVAVMLGLAALWILGALEVFRVEVRLGPDFVSGRGLFGRRVRLAWGGIRTVEWNAGMQWFVIRSDRDRVRVPLYVSGLDTLADELALRVPSLAAAPALTLMRRRRAALGLDA